MKAFHASPKKFALWMRGRVSFASLKTRAIFETNSETQNAFASLYLIFRERDSAKFKMFHENEKCPRGITN